MDELQYLKFQEKTANNTATNYDFTSKGHDSILVMQQKSEQSKKSFLCIAIAAAVAILAIKVL